MDFAINKIAGAFLVVVCAAVAFGAAWGWAWNVVKLVHMLDGPATAMFIARIVGFFAAPLGSILGFM